MNPIDIMKALCDVSEDIIGLRFDKSNDSQETEMPAISSVPPQSAQNAAAKKSETMEIQQTKKASGSAFLSYLLTAGCTVACIAGFSLLIRMSYSNDTEFLHSDAPGGAAITQLTQASVTETTTAATVPVTTAAEFVSAVTEQTASEIILSMETTTDTELLITAETTAQFEIEEITEMKMTEAVTETVSASTAEVTETTVQTTELEMQKPEPVDNLDEKLHQIASGNGSGTVTLLDEMDGEQYGWYIVPDGERSAIVYSETPEILDKAIAENDALSHRTIVRTAYPEAGENCWKLSFVSEHPNQLTYYMAQCLLDVMKDAKCGTLLDIIIEDFKQPLEFETGKTYRLGVSLSVSSELELLEEYADAIDLEHSIAIENFESKSLRDVLDFAVSLSQDDRDQKYQIVYLSIKDTNGHQRLFEIAKELEKRVDVILYSKYFFEE